MDMRITFVGGGNWFTQSIRSSPFTPLAFGQVEYAQQRATINWMLPCYDGEYSALLNLVENLAFEAGLRGNLFLLASAILDSEEFTLLRRQGFCTYGWEKYWRVDTTLLPTTPLRSTHWRRTNASDQHDILQFQRHHLAPALRAVMPLANEFLPDNVLLIDVASRALPQPIFHPVGQL